MYGAGTQQAQKQTSVQCKRDGTQTQTMALNEMELELLFEHYCI